MSTYPGSNLSKKIIQWKQISKEVAVHLKMESGNVSDGVVYVQTWSLQERTRRALKWLAILWGFGAFCIIFPIIHFILPPLLFITGPVIAYLLSRQYSAVLGGTGKCPDCKVDFEIVRGNYLNPADSWPLRDLCSHCRKDVSIGSLGAE